MSLGFGTPPIMLDFRWIRSSILAIWWLWIVSLIRGLLQKKMCRVEMIQLSSWLKLINLRLWMWRRRLRLDVQLKVTKTWSLFMAFLKRIWYRWLLRVLCEMGVGLMIWALWKMSSLIILELIFLMFLDPDFGVGWYA